MNEHPHFLQAVIERPDDDAPRLIYADWLAEQGESLRAEFIRLHCRLSQLLVAEREVELVLPYFRSNSDYGIIDSKLIRPEARAVLLRPLLELGLRESEASPTGGDGPGCRFFFRRGFVEHLIVSHEECVADFGRCAAEVLSLTPLTKLTLSTPVWRDSPKEAAPRVLRVLAGLPETKRLQALEFSSYGPDDAAAQILLESPHIGPQTILSFDSGFRMTPNMYYVLRQRFGDRLHFWSEHIRSRARRDGA
jgi:uncharacterized protein (TIGR02996 family)